jgi:hypothetical protein
MPCYTYGGAEMESKLTLKLDSETINRAKRYVDKHKGLSLSRLVEGYFKSLTSEEDTDKAIPPIVSSLAGVAMKVKNKDLKGDYTEYLAEKYR